MQSIRFLLELDRIFITWYDLKLSLVLLFEIRNILSLEWSTGRTYLSKKKKNEKIVDYHGSTKKK